MLYRGTSRLESPRLSLLYLTNLSRTLLEQRGILASFEAQEIMHVVKNRTSSMI